jgi:hypothetical protein
MPGTQARRGHLYGCLPKADRPESGIANVRRLHQRHVPGRSSPPPRYPRSSEATCIASTMRS